jgi:hypothetical protein
MKLTWIIIPIITLIISASVESSEKQSHWIAKKRHEVNSRANNHCANSAVAKVVRATYDTQLIEKTANQLHAKYIKKAPNLESAFSYNPLYKSATRTFSVAEKNTIPAEHENTIMYNLKVEGEVTSLKVNQSGTIVDGIALKHLLNGVRSKVSDCLLEELNKYLAASVSANGLSSKDGVLTLPIGYFRLPVIDGDNIKQQQCNWRFYLKDTEISTMLGSCP